MDRQQQAAAQAADVRILQKVNAVHKDAFLAKYPTQVEHCLRLVMERLQAGLDKRDGCDVGDPDTWRMTTQELRDLAETAHQLDHMRQQFGTVS
jgi:hypothetical protein